MILLSLFLLEIMFILFLINKREFCYHKLSGIVVKKNQIVLIVNSKEKKLLYQNKYVLYKGKSIPYKIVEDKGMILEKSHQKYSELQIEIRTLKEKKINNGIELMVKEKKKSILELLKYAWGR